jgi:hypothetical protein
MRVEVFYPHLLSNWPLVLCSSPLRDCKLLLGFIPSICRRYLLCIQWFNNVPGLTMKPRPWGLQLHSI